MINNRRNSSSGIIILFLMFFFFSFIHEEKERQVERSAIQSSVITDLNSPGQAITGPTISATEVNYFLTSSSVAKFVCLESTSIRESFFSNFVSSSFNTIDVKFQFRNLTTSLFLLQKVPEQGMDDDILLIA